MKMKKDLELYVHIPFCVKKCEYCDFLSFPAGRGIREDYVKRLKDEIKWKGGECTEYQAVSVFIGGGTPSILDGDQIGAVMAELLSNFDVRSKAEITIEANPGTVSPEKARVWALAGINRVSLGLQSTDDGELRRLGRIHTYDSFLKSYERVRVAGIENVNIDLMSALPGQTAESWKRTLKRVTMLRPEHISAYSLMIEEGTPFFEKYGRPGMDTDLPDEDAEIKLCDITKEHLQKAGYGRYEISNYARPGFECIHNMGYWTGTEYLGIGLGSSSYMNNFRFRCESGLERYLKGDFGMLEERRRLFFQDAEKMNTERKMEEFMFLGLRMTRGVSQHEFASRFGHSIWSVYGNEIQKLDGEGLLDVGEEMIRLTDRGLDVSNYAMSCFLLD